MSHVFPRVVTRTLPTAVSAEGAWIVDSDGRRYLDGSGGAIVVGVGHRDASLIAAAEEQLHRTQYVHGTMFTTDAVEAYAEDVAHVLPLSDARVYPVSGGSEAVETALKMARAYHVARGNPGRVTVIARRSSYHGNTIGALDASGKEPLRKPYTPWLGRFLHAPPAYEYRCENPAHPEGCGDWHAAELTRMIGSYGPETIAAFIAEPVAGATLGAAVPCDDYWPKIVDVCRAHGVLVIADEVMTGFGHGFTWSHNALGAAVAHATLRRLRDDGLVDRSRELGASLLGALRRDLEVVEHVGDVRGVGTMIGIELVRDRETKEPFARERQITERTVAAARDAGLLLYSSTGHVGGRNGDLVMLGPPFTLTDDEAGLLVERTVSAIRSVA